MARIPSLTRRFNPCDNMNHRRSNAPVGHCPQCGGVVNGELTAEPCNESKHSAARLRQSTFCVDCGVRLVVSR
jgi:hypothetical protein